MPTLTPEQIEERARKRAEAEANKVPPPPPPPYYIANSSWRSEPYPTWQKAMIAGHESGLGGLWWVEASYGSSRS